MVRKMISTWGMIFVLMASIVGTAAAQEGSATETEPAVTTTVEVTETPTVIATTPPAGTQTYSHPVVQILSAYFGRKGASTAPQVTPTPLVTPDPNATPDPALTPVVVVPIVPGPDEIAAQIAQYHEDGLGFGVLVKLYAMAEASAENCASQPAPGETEQTACSVVTVEELVSAVQGGAGMGNLFQEYGKPAMLGVGHVKQEMKNQSQESAAATSTLSPEMTSTPSPDMQIADEKGKDKGKNSGENNSSKQPNPKPSKDKGAKKDK